MLGLFETVDFAGPRKKQGLRRFDPILQSKYITCSRLNWAVYNIQRKKCIKSLGLGSIYYTPGMRNESVILDRILSYSNV